MPQLLGVPPGERPSSGIVPDRSTFQVIPLPRVALYNNLKGDVKAQVLHTTGHNSEGSSHPQKWPLGLAIASTVVRSQCKHSHFFSPVPFPPLLQEVVTRTFPSKPPAPQILQPRSLTCSHISSTYYIAAITGLLPVPLNGQFSF